MALSGYSVRINSMPRVRLYDTVYPRSELNYPSHSSQQILKTNWCVSGAEMPSYVHAEYASAMRLAQLCNFAGTRTCTEHRFHIRYCTELVFDGAFL
ncbi:hypothetical protein ACSS6W_003573 [Trichoderma asperelloides]